jgi:hypothetical protein
MLHEPVSDLKPRVIGLALGSERTPDQFAAQIAKEIGIWRKVAADAGV